MSHKETKMKFARQLNEKNIESEFFFVLNRKNVLLKYSDQVQSTHNECMVGNLIFYYGHNNFDFFV